MYVDSHAHLSSRELYPDIDAILQRAKDAKVEAIVNICTDSETLLKGMELKQRKSEVFLTAATTPHDVKKDDPFFREVQLAAASGKLVAIGETGLDYYYEHAPKELQKLSLQEYFSLALKTNLPLVFHCRDAFSDLFSLADEGYRDSPAVLHCFTGSLLEAKAVLDRGWYISLSGIVSFKKSEALREVAAYVPLDRLLIETDAPYLAPQSQRGKRNEPSFLPETAAVIAQVKNISEDLLAQATCKNAYTFFSFSKQIRVV